MSPKDGKAHERAHGNLPISIGLSSMTGEMIFGYLVDNHLNAAGIPMAAVVGDDGRGLRGYKPYRRDLSCSPQRA